MIKLYDHQIKALQSMKNGCILCGGVGSGKSLTSLSYYYLQQGGEPNSLLGGAYCPMDDRNLRDLYIITTAHKRDSLEWEGELVPFLLSTNDDVNIYSNKVVVDSWNNIKKYSNVYGAFFIFDEQRVVGSGTWVKSFLKIAKKNKWILLSATPGDSWQDYIPVFIANGFYKNKTEFIREHVVYSRFSKFPKIDRYIETTKLNRFRRSILVDMPFERHTNPINIDVYTKYDIKVYKTLMKDRWNIWKDKPIENAGELCYSLRKVVNSDESRIKAVSKILEEHSKVIIFYNFDYELDMLKNMDVPFEFSIAEYNGHKHEEIPGTKHWIYLVQYLSGAEGWNCTMTDTIIFLSQNYSYKVLAQAKGRIDRLNTPYTDLYYYHLKSHANIDLSIGRALKNKKTFNETGFKNKVWEK